MPLPDRFMPSYQFAHRHERHVGAPPGLVLDAAQRLELADDPLVRRLIGLRMALRRPAPGRTGGLTMRDFVFLGRDGDRAIGWGLLGRFWRPDGGLITLADAETFATAQPPGTAKLVWTFQASPERGGTRLETTTRVACADHVSLLRFTPYWCAIRPFSGMIRRRLLARVAHKATRPHPARG